MGPTLGNTLIVHDALLDLGVGSILLKGLRARLARLGLGKQRIWCQGWGLGYVQTLCLLVADFKSISRFGENFGDVRASSSQTRLATQRRAYVPVPAQLHHRLKLLRAMSCFPPSQGVWCIDYHQMLTKSWIETSNMQTAWDHHHGMYQVV